MRQRKNLVIVFFHGMYCAHCVAKLKELAEAWQKFQDLETEVLAVSFDSPDSLRRLEKRVRIPFHLVSDQTGETTARFTYVDPRSTRHSQQC